MTATLHLDELHLASIADPATTTPAHRDLLRRTTRSARLTRLVVLARRLEDEAHELVERSGFGPAMAVLRSLPAGELGQVVDHPYFGAWLSEAYSLLGRDAHRRLATGHVESHLGRIASFAVSGVISTGGGCRLRSRLSATAVLPIAPGRLILMLPLDLAGLEVSVEVDCDRLRVSLEAGDPVAEYDVAEDRLIAGRGTLRRMPVSFGMTIDAASDERRHGADPHAFLDQSAVDEEGWCRATAGAIACLSDASAALLDDVMATTTLLVPLTSPDPRTVRNHTSSAMFGLVATSLPAGDAALAEVLVHETQHSKLHVVENLTTLALDGAQDLCSPWRPDPRPASGLLHGAFSFAAVAELWAALAASRDAPGREAAAAEAVHRREQVLAAVAILRSSDRLTRQGSVFVDEVERRANALHALDHMVAAADVRRARDAIDQHRSRWQERHGSRLLRSQVPRRIGPAPAVAAITAGLGGAPPANVAGSRHIRHDPTMRRIGQLSVLDPTAFDQLASTSDGLAGQPGAHVLGGHIAYVKRDFTTALLHYRAALAEDPADIDRWADLAFCLRQLGRFDESTAILGRLDELAGDATTMAVPS